MGEPAKAQLIPYWSTGRGDPIQLLYNPSELSIDKSVQLAEITIPGLGAPPQQFVRGQAERLSVELFFDTTDKGMGATATSVTVETDKIYSLARIEPKGHAPPVVEFVWGASIPGRHLLHELGNQGRETFKGVVESVKHKFTLFSPEGVPLRATVSLVLREFAPLHEQLPKDNPSSPDRSHAHTLAAGETLSHVAHRYYLRAGEWRPIARANGIRDPRRLDPGRVLQVPALVDGGQPMSFVELAELSAAPHYRAFYVPHFEIRLAGAPIPDNVVRDVVQITYTDDIEGIDSVDLTVNNWDPSDHSCTYIGSETTEEFAGGKPADQRLVLFEPGPREMQVWLGYVGALRLASTVYVTSMEPSFTSGGPPVLIVRGLNVLHWLRKERHSYPWTKRRPAQIARELGTLRNPDGSPRLPLPVELVDGIERNEEEIDFIAQDNQYDIDFLLSLARRQGYNLIEVPAKGRKARHLLFGPSAISTKPVDYRLEWGRSLVEFKPQLSTTNQVRKVTVRGWDQRRKTRIEGSVDLNDREVRKINPDLHRLLKQADARAELVVDQPVFTVAEAKKRALALLQDRLKQMVKATGTTVGLPDLRAGSRLEIAGVGARLGGSYFVTGTTHTLGESGYTTRFTARRESERAPA